MFFQDALLLVFDVRFFGGIVFRGILKITIIFVSESKENILRLLVAWPNSKTWWQVFRKGFYIFFE